MDNWEFLLQKQGDKSWLPLESPTVEILEGQYRLASRSRFANMQISIQLSYEPVPDSGYRGGQQKISKQVSPEGLLVVMPYTNFTPGAWHITCANAEEWQGLSWSTSIQFDVLPTEFGSAWQSQENDREKQGNIDDRQPPVPSQQIPSQLVRTVSRIDALNQTPQPVRADAVATASPPSEAEQTEERFTAEAPEVIPEESPATLLKSLFALDRAQYLVTAGQLLEITGEAYASGELEILLRNPQNLDLLVNRRQSIAPPADRQSGPFPFRCEINIPQKSHFQVIVGEVRLYPTDKLVLGESTITSQAIAVTYQPVNVLAEMTKESSTFLGNKQQTPPPSDRVAATDSATDFASQPALPQLSPKLNSPTAAQIPPQTSDRQPTASETVPANFPPRPTLPPLVPKINAPNSIPNKPPLPPVTNVQLPLLPKNPSLQQTEQTPPQTASEVSDGIFEFELPPGVPAIDRAPAAYQDPVEVPLNPLQSDELEGDLFDELEESQAQEQLPKLEKGSPSLQSLKLGDRFFDKLHTLSIESVAAKLPPPNLPAEQAETDSSNDLPQPASGDRTDNNLLNSPDSTQLEALSVEQTGSNNIEQPLAIEDLALELEQLLIQGEQSILQIDRDAAGVAPITDDGLLDLASDGDTFDEIEGDRRELTDERSENANTGDPLDRADNETSSEAIVIDEVETPLPEKATWPTLPVQNAVPLPILEIPDGEVVAGTPILASVRLPASCASALAESFAPKVFVRLWVKDCQTRETIDGPFWLVDFTKENDTDFAEARTQITIPLGSIDVAFEAVSVEMQTQRESHKTRIIRAVAPPNFAQSTDINFDAPQDA